PFAIRLEGALDQGALARALTELVRRHEVLRTSFVMAQGRPSPVIREPAPVVVPLIRWPDLPLEGREEAARRAVAEESRRPFDLPRAPLLRACLFEVGEHDHVLSLTLHHIVSDAWTRGILNRELSTLYRALSLGQPSPLPELPIQYADFAAWQ